jgi:hypothetical protein
VVEDGLGQVDVDAFDLAGADAVGVEDVEERIEGGVKPAHRRVGLHDDALGLPPFAEPEGDLVDVGVVTLAERGEVPSIGLLEHALDAGEAATSEQCRVQAVPGGHPVVHALAHRTELRGHPGRTLAWPRARGPAPSATDRDPGSCRRRAPRRAVRIRIRSASRE